MKRRTLAAAALLVAVPAAAAIGLGHSSTTWQDEAPTSARRTAGFQAPELTESSGAAASRRRPGVFWTLNDGGNKPHLFATDTLGRALGGVVLAGVRNIDWEAVALAPCPAGVERGRAADAEAGGECLYVGDTGDNRRERPEVLIHRFAEPARDGTIPAREIATLRVRYPDGAHDVEAMFVAPGGDVHLITKPLQGEVVHFRVPAAAWAREEPATAERMGTLPIDPGTLGRWVTDAALAPDGRTVVVRTYRDLFRFRLADDGRLVPGDPPARCDVSGREPQGEGVTWLDERTLVLTSERAFGVDGGVHVVQCPSFVVRPTVVRPADG